MLQSSEKLIVVLVDKGTGKIIAYKELPVADIKKPYYLQVRKAEEQLVHENSDATSSPRFFTGMATNFDAFISGYPEMSVACK